MINDIRQAIAEKLLQLYPDYICYTEEVPQDINPPAFSIMVVEHEYAKQLNTRFKGRISFEVTYYPSNASTGLLSDCINVQEVLMRNFNSIGNLRVNNRKAQIKENKLHLVIEFIYIEVIAEEQEATMRSQTTKTHL